MTRSLLVRGMLVGVVAGLLAFALAHWMPRIDEVPTGFPATLLWRFWVAALEMQLVIWGTVGLLFGWLTERAGRTG